MVQETNAKSMYVVYIFLAKPFNRLGLSFIKFLFQIYLELENTLMIRAVFPIKSFVTYKLQNF